MGPPFGKRAARSTAEASNVLDKGPWADGSQNLSAKGTGLGTLQKREGIVGKQHPGRPQGRAELSSVRASVWGLEVPTSSGSVCPSVLADLQEIAVCDFPHSLANSSIFKNSSREAHCLFNELFC